MLVSDEGWSFGSGGDQHSSNNQPSRVHEVSKTRGWRKKKGNLMEKEGMAGLGQDAEDSTVGCFKVGLHKGMVRNVK